MRLRNKQSSKNKKRGCKMQVGNLIEVLKKYPTNYKVAFTGCYIKDGAIFDSGTCFIGNENTTCFIRDDYGKIVEIYNRLERCEK